MKIKVFSGIALFLLSVSSVFAAWGKKPEIRWQQVYRYDLRQHDQQLYTNRLSLTFNCLDKKEKSLLKITPFFEARRNIREGLWEREELGIEIGRDIFSWFYLGESIQASWLRENYCNYTSHKRRDTIESETIFLASHELFSRKNFKLKGFVRDEYTYDFDIGAGTRNEITMGFIIPVGKYIETGLDWRHIDRIHDYDSDTFEVSLILVF